MSEKDENEGLPPYQDIEPFVMNARSNVAEHSDDPTLLLLGAQIDESVKWMNVPTIGRKSVVRVFQDHCPVCGKLHNAADLGNHEGKTLYTIRCVSIGQFVVYKK